MLPAIEAPAQQRTPLIYSASLGSEVHACAVRRSSQQKHLTSVPAGNRPELVRRNLVPLFRMQKQSLIAATALRAPSARHFGLLRRRQTTF